MNLQGVYGAVPLAHFFLRQRLAPGDRGIDATCGNGLDTVLMAELVGPDGLVWAFDIQEEAVAKTGQLLVNAGLGERVRRVASGHETMADVVTEPVRAIVFNLGYLPAGGREIKTLPASTLAALEQALSLLLPAGIILVSVYTGHEGGGAEWAAVKGWAETLNPHEYNVWLSRQLNRSEKAPFLLMVEKMPQA